MAVTADGLCISEVESTDSDLTQQGYGALESGLHDERTTGDSKRMSLQFSSVEGYPQIARTLLRLHNVSSSTLKFKFKCEANCDVAAHPSSSGVISPNSTCHRVLTWHLPPDHSSWSRLRSPHLAVVTNFYTGMDANTADNIINKFVASLEKVKRTKIETEMASEHSATIIAFTPNDTPSILPSQQRTVRRELEKRTKGVASRRRPVSDLRMQWINAHPMRCLVIAVIVFMVVVCALSADRSHNYYN